jgi:hypothetical protein
MVRAHAREIERDRDPHRPGQRGGRIGALLAEPLHQHVAADRHAHRAQPQRRLARAQRADHVIEIAGLTR